MKNVYSLFFGVLFMAVSVHLSGQNYALQFAENTSGYQKNTVTTYGLNFTGNTTLSIEAWVNMNSFQVGSPIVFKENGGNCSTPKIAIWFFIDEIGRMGLGLGNGTDFNAAFSNSTLNTGEWHHVAATWDGSLITLYLDGVEDGTLIAGGQLYDDGEELNIGNRWNCYRRSFDGTLDELRIWNDVRTDTELNDNMYKELNDPALEADLALYYTFNEGTGTTTYDQSANDYDGQLGGVTFPASTTTAPMWVDSDVPFFTCPTVEVSGNDLVYYGYNPAACATLTADVTDGTAPFTFEWSNGETGQSIEVCPDETTVYTVTVTDANDCSVSSEFIVDVIDVRCGWGGNKVLICHSSIWWPDFTYTICAHKFFVPWLLYFGDQLGSCDNYKSAGIIDGIPEFETEAELQQFDQEMFAQYKLSNPGLIKEKFEVYPNPVSTYATVSFTTLSNELATIEVYDMIGQKVISVFQEETEAGQNYQLTLDASNLPTGSYLLIMKQGESVKRQKLTIK